MPAHILELAPPPADHRLHYGPAKQHFGDLRLPDGSGPHVVAVVVHGGFWRSQYNLEHIGHACAALTAAGLATWSVEYRRVGDQGGRWPGTLWDVGQAADYLRELAGPYKLDLQRVVAVGHSAGGHLALWLAGRQRLTETDPLYSPHSLSLCGVVALAPLADLRYAWELGLSRGAVGELMGGPPDEHEEEYATASPIEMLPLGVPQILLHGTDDDTVPYEISTRYLDRALALGDEVSLIELKGAGHFEVIDPRSAEWEQVAAAVKRFAAA